MNAHLAWDRGGEARVLSASDDDVVLLSTAPSQPGSRPEGALGTGERVRLKVHRCAREGEAFRIEGRLLDAPRRLRERLLALALARGG